MTDCQNVQIVSLACRAALIKFCADVARLAAALQLCHQTGLERSAIHNRHVSYEWDALMLSDTDCQCRHEVNF